MKCTILQFRTLQDMRAYLKVANVAHDDIYVNERELFIKGLFEKEEIELACFLFKAMPLESLGDN